MPKNIVILLDGTSNEVSENRSNILRLYSVLEKNDRQLVYYDPGVGTFGAENSWLRFWRNAVQAWGMATGWGIDENVKEAYRFLIENYDNGKRGDGKRLERDRIYIFGFSRGAYTARVLAGFIHAVGLIERRNLNLLDYAYRAYKRVGADGDEKKASFHEVRQFENMLATDRPPIRLLGLFDTVSSVIEHGRFGPRLRSHAFTAQNKSVETVRHAVALDERRTMFRPQLWPAGGPYWGNPFNSAAAKPQDVKEVWFRGVHGDVGGGYPETESGLAKIPLHWMIEQTAAADLHFIGQTVKRIVLGKRRAGDDGKGKDYVPPDPSAKPHNSMSLLWSIVEFLPQLKLQEIGSIPPFGIAIPLFARRDVPAGALIHHTAINGSGGKPRNLPVDHAVEP